MLIYTSDTHKEGHAVPKVRGILTPLSSRLLLCLSFARNVMQRSLYDQLCWFNIDRRVSDGRRSKIDKNRTL